MDQDPEEKARKRHHEELAENSPKIQGAEALQNEPQTAEQKEGFMERKSISPKACTASVRDKGELEKDGTSSENTTNSPQTEQITHGKRDNPPQEQAAANAQENEGFPREGTADMKNKFLPTERGVVKEENQSCEKEQTVGGKEKKGRQNVHEQESLQPEVKESKECLQPGIHPTAALVETSKTGRGEVCENPVGRPEAATAPHAEEHPAQTIPKKTCPQLREGDVDITQKDVSQSPGKILRSLKLNPYAQEFIQTTTRKDGKTEAPRNSQSQHSGDKRTLEQTGPARKNRNPFYIPKGYNCTYHPLSHSSANFQSESQQPRGNSAASTGLYGTSGINLNANSNRQTPAEPGFDRRQPDRRHWEASMAGIVIPTTVGLPMLAPATGDNDESRNEDRPKRGNPNRRTGVLKKPTTPYGKLCEINMLPHGRILLSYCSMKKNVGRRKRQPVDDKKSGAVRSEKSSEDQGAAAGQGKAPGDGAQAATLENSSTDEQQEGAASHTSSGQGQDDGLSGGQEVTTGSPQLSGKEGPSGVTGGASLNETSAEEKKTTVTTQGQGSVEEKGQPSVENTLTNPASAEPKQFPIFYSRRSPQPYRKGRVESEFLSALSGPGLLDNAFCDQQPASAQEPKDCYPSASKELESTSFRLGWLEGIKVFQEGDIHMIFRNEQRRCALKLTASDRNFLLQSVDARSRNKRKKKRRKPLLNKGLDLGGQDHSPKQAGLEDTGQSKPDAQQDTKQIPDKEPTNKEGNGSPPKAVYTPTRNTGPRESKKSVEAGSEKCQTEEAKYNAPDQSVATESKKIYKQRRKPRMRKKKASAVPRPTCRGKGQGSTLPDSGQPVREELTSKYPSDDGEKTTTEEGRAIKLEDRHSDSNNWARQSEHLDV